MECMRNQLKEGTLLDGRFETISPLNHGSFGMVFKAKDLLTGNYVALKCLTKPDAVDIFPSDFAVDDQSEELAIHLRIGSHPNIVNLVHSFETKHHTYLVLEYCPNGDLYEAIRLGRGPLETAHVRDFMLELVGAVEYMHSKGIYHRDIKPENIFLSQSGSMKLGDFGLATADAWSFEAAVGSDRYMAPEQYETSVYGYSPAQADVWAIGICLLNILFARNPFATPTISDPLFADFAADRQTLFDVFPTMSQDTFEIIIHSLAIDPASRSLSAVKRALERVVSFTTDDEVLDEFCTEDRDLVPATAHREPLRTPSISTPMLDQGGSFPWAKALAMSPPLPIRQLSAIPDVESYSEDLFPASADSSQSWFDIKPETASVVSFVDSGLGVSLESIGKADPIKINRSRPMLISGSLPASAARPIGAMSSVFGGKRDVVSKSWSDLWDEEEEENAFVMDNEVFWPKSSTADKHWSQQSESSGHSTPRGLTEVKNPATVHNSRDRTPRSMKHIDDQVSEQTGFIFEPHCAQPSKHSPPSKRSVLDKWAALGDRRRAPTPQKPASMPVSSSIRKRSRAGSWRRAINFNQPVNESNVFERKEWSMSKDWRQHPVPADDVGDLEWVGGWNDLHL